jgi:hypothetical protein
MTNAPLRSVLDLLSTVRDERRERREARDAFRALQQELAAYSTPREVNDLLGTIRDQEGAEAQLVRDILLDNLSRRPHQFRAA